MVIPTEVLSDNDIEQFDNNEKVKTIFFEFIFKHLIEDCTFSQKYLRMKESYYINKVECIACRAEQPKDYKIDSIERVIYQDLVKKEINWLIEKFEEKYMYNPKAILNVFETDIEKVEFILNNIYELYENGNDDIKGNHSFILSFKHPENGGEGWQDFFSFLYNFITNEFIKSVLYDLIKYSAISIFTIIILNKNYFKIRKKANEKLLEYIEDHELLEKSEQNTSMF